MNIRFLRVAAGIAAVAALTSCDPAPTGPEPAALASVTMDARPITLAWHEVARDLVAANNLNALAAGRLYAAVGMAQRAAIAAVDGTGAGSSNAQGYGAGGRSLYEARRGAAAGASARVLGFLVPSAVASLEQLLDAQASPHPQYARGVDIGRSAGAAMVQRLMNDGFTAPFTGTPLVGPGVLDHGRATGSRRIAGRRVAVFPHLGDAVPSRGPAGVPVAGVQCRPGRGGDDHDGDRDAGAEGERRALELRCEHLHPAGLLE
jgi:hypothetical protein